MNDTMNLIGGPARDFAAGVAAAAKLARLIERCETIEKLYGFGWGSEARSELRLAIEEAKR